MTVGTTNNTTVLTANGSTTVFPYTFLVVEEEHLSVQRRITATGVIDKIYTAGEYTVAGIGTTSGSVTFSTAPTAGHEIIIIRTVPYTQELDINNQGGFFPEAVEEQLDLMVMQTQQLATEFTRTIKFPVGEEAETLPAASLRASRFLAFDADGNPLMSNGSGADLGLRQDLGSHDEGLGAGLVALRPVGTVQEAISWVTPQMFGATADGTVHYLNEICDSDDDFRAQFPYAWAIKEKYLWTRTANNAADGGITFPGGVTIDDLTRDWAALCEVMNNPAYANVHIPAKTYVVTDIVVSESKNKFFAWAGATIKSVRKCTRGNVFGFFEAGNVYDNGHIIVDANYIYGDNCFTIGQALAFAVDVDDSLFPDGIVATGSEAVCYNLNLHVTSIHSRWKDANPGRAGGKGDTLQQGFIGCTMYLVVEDCDIGVTIEGRDSYTAINATATEPFIAAGNQIFVRAKDCARAGLWLTQPTTPRPTNPLNTYGTITLVMENCGYEYGGLFGYLNFDRASGWDVDARIAHRPRGLEMKRSFLAADVNAGADTITLDTTDWRTGDPVRYASTADISASQVGGLSNDGKYYLIVVDGTTLKLATTQANALAGTAINLTSGGSAYKGATPTHFLENVSSDERKSFAPGDVSTANSTIALTGHGYRNGYLVRFESTTSLPGGLAIDTDYFVSVFDADTFGLAFDYDEAVAPIRPNQSFLAAAVSTAADTITIAGHPYETGDSVYLVPGSTGMTVDLTDTTGATVSTLLSDRVKINLIVVDANTLKLAESAELAEAGTAINITDPGVGTHVLGSLIPLTSQGTGTHTAIRRRAAVLVKGTPSHCTITIGGVVDSLLHAWNTQQYPDGSNHSLSQPVGVNINFAEVFVRGETYGSMIREQVGAAASPGGGVDGGNMRITYSQIHGMFVGLPSTAEAFYYNTSATNWFDVWDATNLRRVEGRAKSTTNFRTDRTDWSGYRHAITGSTAISILDSSEFSFTTGTNARWKNIIGGNFIQWGSGTPNAIVSAPIGSIHLRSDGNVATAVNIKHTGSGNTGWLPAQLILPSTTAGRPTLAVADAGFMMFDTTLSKPIWWTGTGWVDGTGTAA